MKTITFALALLVLGACGKQDSGTDLSDRQDKKYGNSDVVVRSRAEIAVSSSAGRLAVANKPITISNQANSSMTIDDSNFSVPAITPSWLQFGHLFASALSDNNLRVCGSSGKDKCGTALIRIYTTGTAGAGLWNAEHGYGIPLSVTHAGTDFEVGLEAANASVVHQLSIASNKNVIRLQDFSPELYFYFGSDFSNAGAGDYSTTLVIEYALAP